MNTIHRRIAQLGFAFAGVMVSLAAFPVYVVNQIDYQEPGSGVANFTQLWGNTNDGRVIGVASYDAGVTSFSFIYDPATGLFSRIAQPPGFDGIMSVASAISLNDSGTVTGGTFEPAAQRGFVLSGGVYSFFDNPGWVNSTGRTVANPTAAHPQGLVVGFSDNGASLGSAVDSSTGFVYDPATSTFAQIVTPNSFFTIAQGLNIGGQIVGHVTYEDVFATRGSWGFLFTPTTGADPMLGGTVNYFRIAGGWTKARGINDNGVLAAAVFDHDGTRDTEVYVGTSVGFQLINVPSAAGPATSDCPNKFSFPEGLNNAGQVTGLFTDASCNYHGFIATPVSLPTGTTSSGAYTFSVDVVANTPIFIDPKVAVGYDYVVGAGDPLFATVRLPLGIGDNKYRLIASGKAHDLNAGQLFDFRAHGFPAGVSSFRVSCIDVGARLDPVNSLAFPTELTFTGAGTFTGTMAPLIFNANDHAAQALAQANPCPRQSRSGAGGR